MERVHLSVCASLDGHIDHAGAESLCLSSEEDRRDIHALRAGCDAILVGAGTVRRDDPRLTVRYPDLMAARKARGLPEQPARVVLTRTGEINPNATFFAATGRRLVLCPEAVCPDLRARFRDGTEVVGVAEGTAPALLAALARLGIRRLLVEGGSCVLTLFLSAGAFHALRLAVAPFFVGDGRAPRMVGPASFLHGPDNRLRLEGTRTLGDVAVMDLVNPTPRL